VRSTLGVLLVARDRLGAINQTLLALSALELAGAEVCGVVLTGPAVPDPSTGNNAGAIARLTGLERVVGLPWQSDPHVEVPGLEKVLHWILLAPRKPTGHES